MTDDDVMRRVQPLPRAGEVYLDARGDDRALRVSWHSESGVVVVSLWRENVCTATFQLGHDQVPDLIAVLQASVDASYAAAVARRRGQQLGSAG